MWGTDTFKNISPWQNSPLFWWRHVSSRAILLTAACFCTCFYPCSCREPTVCVPCFVGKEIYSFRAEMGIFLAFQISITDFLCLLLASRQQCRRRWATTLVVHVHKWPQSPELPFLPLLFGQQSGEWRLMYLWALVQATLWNKATGARLHFHLKATILLLLPQATANFSCIEWQPCSDGIRPPKENVTLS